MLAYRKILMGTTCLLGLGLAQPGWAQSAATPLEARMQALEQLVASQQATIARQQQELDALKGQVSPRQVPATPGAGQPLPAPPASTSPAGAPTDLAAAVIELQQSAAEARQAEQARPRVTVANARPAFTSPDGRSSLTLRGIFQVDAGLYSQDDPVANDPRRGSIGGAGNRENIAAADLSSGMNLRRARIGAEGTIAGGFNYRLLLELAGTGTEGPARINDAWIAYSGLSPVVIQAGVFAPSANLSDATLVDDQLLMERPSSAELSRTLGAADGRFGVSVRSAGDWGLASLAFTTRTVNDPEVFDSQQALVGRIATRLLRGESRTLHIGLNGTRVFTPPDAGLGATPRYPIRLRDRPELRLDSTRLIDTGAIDAEGVTSIGAEFGLIWNRVNVTAEAFRYRIDRRASALSDPQFHGGYVEASFSLTGESRRYSTATASFQNMRPRTVFDAAAGTWGGWEAVLRYSMVDLNAATQTPFMAPISFDVRGGEQTIWTAGLNWYLNANLEVMLNVQNVDIDRRNPGSALFGATPVQLPEGIQIGQTYQSLALRTQFSF